MSKVALSGNVSGTGTFTLAAPNSNTDRTLTLPDEAGTVLTSASSLAAANLTGSLPAGMGGKVLQVNTLVDATKKTMSGYTNYTGYSIALSSTLVSTSSKILILTSTFMGHNNNVTVSLNWSSSSSSLSRVSAASGSANDMVDTEAYYSGSDRSGANLSFLKLITPSTTTPQTYYLWSTTATNDTSYLNSSSNGNTTQSLGSSQYWVGQGTTHIVIMEIGA